MYVCFRLAGAASATVKDLQTQTSAGFKYALQSKKVNFCDETIIIALSCVYIEVFATHIFSYKNSIYIVYVYTCIYITNTYIC